MTIGIVGCGTMGSAIAKTLIKKKIVLPSHIVMADHSKDKLKKLKTQLGVQITGDNRLASKADFVVLAVKPQDFSALAQELRGKIPTSTVVISIMAGMRMKKIEASLSIHKIVRSMPNSPAVIGEGMIGWMDNGKLSTTDRKKTERILSAVGTSLRVHQEALLDVLTAISGCGPGFFFMVFDQWWKAARGRGFSDAETRLLLEKTFSGSLKLLSDSGKSPEELVAQVTSRGGATEQGLKVLKKAQLKKTFARMLNAAYNRCRELSS